MEVKELKTLVKLVKGKKPKSLSETKTKTHSEPYLLAKVIRGTEKPKFGKEDEMVVVSSSDLVIISDGDAGEVFQGLSGGLASTMSKIEPLENINLKYLKYFLISNRKLFSDTRTGAAIPHLNKDIFFNLQIPVPSLQEQEKIVARLDKVFENIDKKIEFTNKQIINLEILINSQLKNIFENKENMEIQMRLEDITEKITDGKHGDCENQDQSNFYFLSAKNIKDGKLLYENARQITKKDFEETHKRTDLKPGDLLITNSGTIGRMAIAEENAKTYRTTFQKSVAIVKPNHNLVNNKYLLYFLKNKLINLQNISRGAAQKNLLLRDLRNFTVNLPNSVKSQINTVKKLDSFFSKIIEINTLYQNKLNLLATFKKSILDKEFSHE